MTDAVINPALLSNHNQGVFLVVAWRNLWRNKRRTCLTVGAAAFAMLLIQFMMSLQYGGYTPMIELSTRFGSGHMQVQHPKYKDSPHIENVIADVSILLNEVEDSIDTEDVAARAETFALVSHGEKSFGALIIGVDPHREPLVSDIPSKVNEGRFLEMSNHTVVGAGIARNLGIGVGDELVIIGSDASGSLAAMVQDISGIFTTNTPIDRAMVFVPLAKFQETFSMQDTAHRLLIMVPDPQNFENELATVKSLAEPKLAVLTWSDLVPEIDQSIAIDKVSNALIHWVLIIIIVLSIMNTFVLTMYERTREFGMLIAVGMKRVSVFTMILVEALCLWLVGTVVGFIFSGSLIGILGTVGVPIPGAESFSDQMFLPDRIYATWTASVVLLAPIALGVGTILCAAVVALRVFKLDILEALRDAE